MELSPFFIIRCGSAVNSSDWSESPLFLFESRAQANDFWGREELQALSRQVCLHFNAGYIRCSLIWTGYKIYNNRAFKGSRIWWEYWIIVFSSFFWRSNRLPLMLLLIMTTDRKAVIIVRVFSRIYLFVCFSFFFFLYFSYMIWKCTHKLSLGTQNKSQHIQGGRDLRKFLVHASAWSSISCEMRPGYSAVWLVALKTYGLGDCTAFLSIFLVLLSCLIVTVFPSFSEARYNESRISKGEGIYLMFPTSFLLLCNLSPL